MLLSLVTLTAFAFRISQLGSRSLWVDEAMAVVFAAKPLPELLHLLVTEDIHPPLYPVLLHFWMMVFGNGEAAARFPSVVFGVLLVPLVYLAGARLEQIAERRERAALSTVGTIGSILTATSVYYILYSQEARSYMAVTFMGLLSSYLLLRANSTSKRGDWAAYTLVTAGAVYTDYTAFLLLPFHFIFVVATVRSHRGSWKRWACSILAVAIAYLPWAGYSYSQLQRISDYWQGVLELSDAVQTSLLLFFAGGGIGRNPNQLLLMAALVFLAAGLLALTLGPLRTRSFQPSLFLMLYLVVPPALLFAVAYYRPKFDPRYLLVGTPAFYLIIAWGIALLFRPAITRSLLAPLRIVLALLGVAAMVGTIGASMVYGEPEKLLHVGDGRSGIQEYGDYRSLVGYLERRAEPGDAVMLMMNSYHPYVYYSRQQIPWYPMEPFDDFDGAIIRLNRMVDQGYHRLWFILWQQEWADPADYVMQVMETQAREVPLDASFGGLGLRLFDLVPGQRFNYYPHVDNRAEAVFGDALLEIRGWNVSSTRVKAGDSIRFAMYWMLHQETRMKLKTKVMLMDSALRQYAVVDEISGTPFYQASQWQLKQITPDIHTLAIPVGTPPGTYDAQLMLYDENTLDPLLIHLWSGESLNKTLLSLGRITVDP